jgi:hypothetical protein
MLVFLALRVKAADYCEMFVVQIFGDRLTYAVSTGDGKVRDRGRCPRSNLVRVWVLVALRMTLRRWVRWCRRGRSRAGGRAAELALHNGQREPRRLLLIMGWEGREANVSVRSKLVMRDYDVNKEGSWEVQVLSGSKRQCRRSVL